MSSLMPILAFAVSLIAARILTPYVRTFAVARGVVDRPDQERKRHAGPVPLLGGVAVFLALIVGVAVFWPELVGGFLLPKHLIGTLIGAAILVIGGALDDRHGLPPIAQLAFTALAALAVVTSGIGIEAVSNPLGGLLHVDAWKLTFFHLGGVPYGLVLPADLIAFAWLMAMMYTTKLLDGLDGLVAGLTPVGAVVLAVLSATAAIGQPELAVFALIVAGAFVGFLGFNFRPATIFLGEGGSTLAGFLLGTVAIMAGAKIGITLLVMAVPFLDVAWTVFRRIVLERKSWTASDAKHLHFRLTDLGLSPTKTVLVYWAFAAAFGFIGLLLNAPEYGPEWKAAAFLLLAGAFILVSWKLHRRRP